MKKTTALLAGIGFAMFCHAQITDPGFESWTEKTVSGTTWMEPTEWYTYNQSQVSLSLNKAVSRSNDAHSGNYALQITATVDDGNEQVGIVTSGKTYSGNMTQNNCGERFALTGAISSFSGWYKYTAAQPEDSFVVILLFYLGNQVYGSAYFTGGPADTYQYFNLELSYPENIPPPDSAKFIIGASSYFHSEGSVLLLDDMGVSYKPSTGLTETKKQVSVNVFPNPTTQTLTVTGLQHKAVSYTITDLNGRLITSAAYTNNTIDVETLKTGMYLLLVNTEEGNTLRTKFTKQ